MPLLKIMLLIACSAIGSGAVCAAEAETDLRPTGLRCENLENPLGIDAVKPRLSWNFESAKGAGQIARGQKQTAYQILVASSLEKLAGDEGNLWDSGKVTSQQSIHVEYGGKNLQSCQACYWKVRVWDAQGRIGAWSSPSTWTMGLLQADDWHGKWIGQDSGNAMPIFRKEFAVEKPVRRAEAHVCGLGQYELRLNGAKVGDNVLDPGWTDYRKSCLYTTYDLTASLKQGGNVLGLMLGNGMYNVEKGKRYTKGVWSFGRPKAIVQLDILYADGSKSQVVTDESWTCAPGPIVFSGAYGGEDYDARLERPGWDRPGFSESSESEIWKPVSVVNGPGGILRAQMIPAMKVMKTVKPVGPPQKIKDGWLYDLGQNFSGWPRIVLSGPKGATVRLVPGELLSNGQVNQSSSGRPAYFQYTLKGEGREEWAPRFSYYGFRWVQVQGAAPKDASATDGTPVIEDLEGQVLYPDVRTAGVFECSNPLFNRIHEIINWAIISNMKSVLTDCPHREKLGWLEESYLNGPGVMCNYDVLPLYRKIAQDMAEAQLENGLVPDIAPEYTVFQGGFRDSPEWGSASIISLWLAYQYYGDLQILEKNYSMMQRYLDYLGARAQGHILNYGLGDWYDIGPKGPGQAQLTPIAVTATATYYRDAVILSETAQRLGKTADAAKYRDLSAEILDAFNQKFFDSQEKNYSTGSQTALAMPLVLGLVDPDSRQAIVDRLVKDIRDHGNHTTAGDVGHHYVLKALAQADRSDVIYDMASRKDHPSYGYQIEHGATALTEAWDGPTRGASQNHFMLGHIEEWFYSELGGIQVDFSKNDPQRIVIRPYFCPDIEWVKASYQSIIGRIACEWKRQGKQCSMQVIIPANAGASVCIPVKDNTLVNEGGKPVSQSADVKLVSQEPAQVVFTVGSGEYSFEWPEN
ncbi:MAG: family 78 glycoside hydrolase catalytic domain [Thermoguttaceae bacterium]